MSRSHAAKPVMPPSPRILRAAVVGAPNAGKSTLVNALCGRKVSAVSPKYNTTRDRVMGAVSQGESQLVFFDTPGFVPSEGEGSGRYSAPLVTAAREAVPEAHVVLYVMDAAKRWDDEQRESLRGMLALAKHAGIPVVLVANKIDLLRNDNVRMGHIRAVLMSLHTCVSRLTAPPPPPAMKVSWSDDSAVTSPSAPTDSVLDARLDDLSLPAGGRRAEAALAGVAAQVASLRPAQAERAVLDALLDAFEQAAIAAGLVGPQGFDVQPSPSRRPQASGARRAANRGTSSSPPGRPADMYQLLPPFHAICAKSGEGVVELRDALTRVAVPGEWDVHPDDMAADRDEATIVHEAIREGLLHHLHRELPYRVQQRTRELRRNAAGELVVNVDLLAPSPSAVRILRARGDGPVRAITQHAVGVIGDALRVKVHLFLRVSAAKGAAAEAGR